MALRTFVHSVCAEQKNPLYICTFFAIHQVFACSCTEISGFQNCSWGCILLHIFVKFFIHKMYSPSNKSPRHISQTMWKPENWGKLAPVKKKKCEQLWINPRRRQSTTAKHLTHTSVTCWCLTDVMIGRWYEYFIAGNLWKYQRWTRCIDSTTSHLIFIVTNSQSKVFIHPFSTSYPAQGGDGGPEPLPASSGEVTSSPGLTHRDKQQVTITPTGNLD